MNIEALRAAKRWQDAGHRVALATVVRTWSSAPSPLGSHMVIRDDGMFEGSISGGRLEPEILEAARAVIEEQDVVLKSFGRGGPAPGTERACDDLDVFVEPLGAAHLAAILGHIDARTPIVRVVDVRLGGATLYDKPLVGYEDVSRRAIEHGEGKLLQIDGRPAIFLDGIRPSPRLVLVGGGHLSQELAHLAARADLDVVLIDPRPAFASRERFPHATILAEGPEDAFTHDLEIGPRDAVLALSHVQDLDDPALEAAIASPAFYIGALGSRRAQAKRLARLHERGHAEEATAKIRGPVGLDIGGRGAFEIAVSILAEVLQTLRRP